MAIADRSQLVGPPDPPPARGRPDRAHEPPSTLRPRRPRPFDQTLVDGEDAAPGTPPIGDEDRFVDTGAARQSPDVEQHSRRHPLHLDTHPRQASLRGPLRIAATPTGLDTDEQPVIQHHDEEHHAFERVCRGGAGVDDVVGEEAAPGEVDRVRLPAEHDEPRPGIAATARRTSTHDVARVEAHERAALEPERGHH